MVCHKLVTFWLFRITLCQNSPYSLCEDSIALYEDVNTFNRTERCITIACMINLSCFDTALWYCNITKWNLHQFNSIQFNLFVIYGHRPILHTIQYNNIWVTCAMHITNVELLYTHTSQGNAIHYKYILF